jgi:hypothetical protein
MFDTTVGGPYSLHIIIELGTPEFKYVQLVIALTLGTGHWIFPN